MLNLSAPFIAQFFGAQLQQVIPYCDIVICNESEAEAWASAIGLPDKTDLKATAKALALAPKSNPSRPRVVVFTQGAESTILVSSADPDNPKVYPVQALTSESIVDTNGAGDAFAGGFLGAFVAGKTLDEAVEAGHKLGRMCIQLVGLLILRCYSIDTETSLCRWAPSTNGPRCRSSRMFAIPGLHAIFCLSLSTAR